MENKKNIWIINDYAGTPYYGDTLRHYYLAKEFIKLGYEVYIISASYSHHFKRFPKINGNFTFEKIDNINYIWIKVPNYGDATNKKRVLKWFVFTFKLFFLPLKNMGKPDVIIASPTAPFFVLPSYRFSQKFKSKFIFEVRDIWPLTLVEVGGYKDSNPFIKFMGWFEKFALKKSDLIVSNLSNYGEHIKELGINKDFIWISNAVNIDTIHSKKIQLPMDIEKLFKENRFIIGYIGSFGKTNSIDTYLEAIRQIDKNIDITFLFLGSGELEEEILKNSRQDKRIKLFNRVEKEVAFEVMNRCDIFFKGNPNHRLYKYGISPIKLYEYMLAGKPIVHSTNVVSDIVKLAKCGISVEAQNPEAIKNGIIEFYNMPKEQRDELGKNGKDYVTKHFAYEKLALKYGKLF